jgi:hypothetical protein
MLSGAATHTAIVIKDSNSTLTPNQPRLPHASSHATSENRRRQQEQGRSSNLL